MTAKEMFEQLGYELTLQTDCVIKYKNSDEDISVSIYVNEENWCIDWDRNKKPQHQIVLNKKLHDAIHQQIKEVMIDKFIEIEKLKYENWRKNKGNSFI